MGFLARRQIRELERVLKNTDNLTVIPAGEHSPLGPSSSKRWMHCAGSVNASAGAPDDESQYAAEGTAAHYLSERARQTDSPCINWLGHTFQSGKYKFVVDEEMAESAQAFVDWCAEQPGKPLTETRIDYSEFMPEAVIQRYGKAFGTLDDARMRSQVCYVTDFKHGKGVQEYAEENTQLKLQALGLYCAFDYLYGFEGFQLQICQPRLGHFDSWYISVKDLLDWAAGLTAAGKAVLEGTQFAAGDWCKFCRIRKGCAVRKNAALGAVMTAEEFEDLDQLEVHALRARNAGHLIDTAQLVKILPMLDILKSWIKDMEKRAISELIGGDKIMRAAWKLVEGRSNRKWGEDPVPVMKDHGIDPYKEPVVRSVAEVEKGLGKAQFKELFSEYVVKPPGKPKLARITDKRPEITGQALVEFDNLDDDGDE